MAYITVGVGDRHTLGNAASRRWDALGERRPDLGPAVALQRQLLAITADVAARLDASPSPRLSLPPRYLAAKLSAGKPALANEPIPLPVATLTSAIPRLCDALEAGGAGEAARHIRDEVTSGRIEPGSLLAASLARHQTTIRTGATHRGLAPDLVWLVAELAVAPFVHGLQRRLLAETTDPTLRAALDSWDRGYCPACGSWPALAEIAAGHRSLRCSFCASAWELPAYTCIYCGEASAAFVTAAPIDGVMDRRLEACTTCSGYLKTLDVEALSPFPLLAISDIETTDLDLAAMDHGYHRPALKEFGSRR